MNILVVDHDSDARTLVSNILAAEGYQVGVAETGKLALASVATTRPELILVDFHIPEIMGVEVCRRLKERDDTRDIPVIFMVANAELNERAEAFKTGAVDFVTKPLQSNELLARVRTHLELARLRGEFVKQLEERTAALHESEERFRTIADAAPVLIWSAGLDKLCTFFNKSWLEYTGRTLEQELGNGWTWGVHPDDLPMCYEKYSKAFDERRKFEIEYRLRRADGEYGWVLDRGVPRFLSSGIFAGYIGSAVDITNLKRAQEKALDQQKLESIGALAAGVAHDFNNLLGSIIAEADLALLDTAGPPPLQGIERIRTTAVRASEIVRQLMVYAGHETAELRPVNISRLVEDMLELLKISVSKQAVIHADVAANLPAVAGYVPQIRQMLMNLIINASEALGQRKGLITVRTSRVAHSATLPQAPANRRNGNWVLLEVSDTGCGMTQEQISKIFDPYFTTKFPGRGLGLAVVQGVVRAHNGFINVRSAPGQGTTFEVFLPFTDRGARVAEELPVSPVTEAISRAGTLLLVEDGQTLRDAISRILQKKGFSVLQAESGDAAIALLYSHEQKVDVMLLDLTIPGVSSTEVVRQARRIRPNMKIVLTSAYSAAGSNAFKVPEVVGFIRKPFTLADLLQLLDEAMSPANAISLSTS